MNSNGTLWLTKQGVEVSDFGGRVAELVNELYDGIYHISDRALRTDWSNNQHVYLTVRDTSFSTYDSDLLTKIVVLAHKHNVRASIKAATHGYLKLEFCEVNKVGFFRENHPTISELAAKVMLEVIA